MRKKLVAAAAVGVAAVMALTTGVVSATASPAAEARPQRAPQDRATPARVAVHFNLADGQMPENIALSPQGTAYVTFAAAREGAAVTPPGATRILATIPAPADGGTNTPVLHFALTTGIVRHHDGTLYFLY